MLAAAVLILAGAAFVAQGITPARAASGMPDSAEFGYGMHIDIWGQNVALAMASIEKSGIEWIAVDFDWERHWPQRTAALDLASLDALMSFARTNGKHVLLSLTNAPAWALTPSGPDPELTAGLVAQLTRLYPDTMLAVELFPAANTFDGWGAAPSPSAYASLIKSTAASLQAANRSAVLVAAGLKPVDPLQPGSDLDDLIFLKGLYQAGAAQYVPIISVRLTETAIDPMASPGSASPLVLRHYEAVRQVMIENQHISGLIWITAFTWPQQLNTAATHTAKSTFEAQGILRDSQTQWFTQAYQMMKSQLYIGAAFYGCLNPPPGMLYEDSTDHCLISGESEQTGIHPAYASLMDLISLGNPDSASPQRLEKMITSQRHKSILKAGAP
jgi:hypothetical protein